MMPEIPLSQGKITVVDACDYEWANQWKWYYAKGYAVRKESANGRQIYMHREILHRVGFTSFKYGDHISRDSLDNRRDNLRPASTVQDRQNRSRYSNNKSGFKGVCWHRGVGKWYASIRIKGKPVYLGVFTHVKEAAKIYNKAALEHHGEFAVLNEV